MTQELLLDSPEPMPTPTPEPTPTSKPAAGTAIAARPDLLIASDRPGADLEAARAIPFRTVCEHHLLPFPVWHTSVTRGVRAVGATTVTSALLGALRADARSRAEFFALADVPI